MTNTKFRKKALLSSIAMLLVALVALGSATYAWFLANPSANANGLKVKASASAGIAIASKTAVDAVVAQSAAKTVAFGRSTQFDVASVTLTDGVITAYTSADTITDLSPASFYPVDLSTAPAFYYAAAANSYESNIASTPSFSSTSAYAYERLLVKTSNNAASGDTINVKGVKVTINLNNTTDDASFENTDLAKAIRVAVVGHQAVVGSTVSTASTFLVGVWKATGADAEDSYVNSAHTGIDSSPSYTFTASGSPKNATGDSNYMTVGNAIYTPASGSDAEVDGCYFDIYVYLDGEDSNCFSENVKVQAQTLVKSIDVLVSSNALS